MNKDLIYISTGCLMTDLVVGGAKNVLGGRAGEIINIVGDSSSGKTFMCNEIIASNYHKYGDKLKWEYDDCEAAYSFDSESMYGVNIVRDDMPQSSTVEEAFYNIHKFIESVNDDEFGIYVLDSLDSISSDEADERAEERISAYDKGKEFTKGSYAMGKQKYLSQEFFPQLVRELQGKNVMLIIVSQVRQNIDMFSFEKYTRAGGKALQFYCSHVIWLANVKKIERKGTPIGGVVKLKCTKGKIARPFRECFYSFYFSYGIDDVGSSIDYLFDLRTEKGELSAPLAKSIAWEVEEGKLSVTSPNVGKFLKDEKEYDNVRKANAPSCKFDLGIALDYIQKNESLKAKYDELFAKVMDRDTLIEYIENNGLEEELRQRVIDKWEAFEDSIAVTRRKKYATVPTV